MNDLEKNLESYFDRLWPICRSITGTGFRESLDIVSEIMPTERLRFQTGEAAFDWTIPKEWVVRDAYLIDPNGVKRVEFKKNNLHLLNYSAPFSGKISFSELKNHLYTLPEQPKAIPYLTSYYQERWGFCLTHEEFQSLPEGDYQVVVDTELKNGHVELGEAVLAGETNHEVFFSTYLCHPSMANNELSGPLVAAFLYKKTAALPKRRFTYRFAIVPETIGAICYLSKRGTGLKEKMRAGYQITCVGDSGKFTYKESRAGNTLADRAAKVVLRDLAPHQLIPFTPALGSDERQYCSPGFNLPMGSLMRTMYTCFKEYHTSLDNKDYIDFAAMAGSVEAYFEIVKALEINHTWVNTMGFGEPQLGKRGLFRSLGSQKNTAKAEDAMWWLLNQADGTHDLLAIAEKSNLPMELLNDVALKLAEAGIFKHE